MTPVSPFTVPIFPAMPYNETTGFREPDEQDHTCAELLGSLLMFTRVFYSLRTGRDFELSQPPGRETHFKTICRALMDVFYGKTRRLIINVAPRYGKTELLIHFVAWALAQVPAANFIYCSYGMTLAKKQTQTIRSIITLPHYKKLFHVELNKDSTAKDNFETTGGGSVYAVGAGGAITGHGAGIANSTGFGGAIIIDDIHKPIEVHSDTMREGVKDWYRNTMLSRVNDRNTPIIFIGQRLHEDDLPANLMKEFDGEKWTTIILPSLDENLNALYPEKHTTEELLKLQKLMKYDFAAQHMQNPIPAGGALYSKNDFIFVDEKPEFIKYFITCDTAETSDIVNDATALSLWGLYEIKDYGENTGILGIMWLDCRELWKEPSELEPEFIDFYQMALRKGYRPEFAVIEEKSTGTYLCSLLKKRQGLQIIPIKRNKSHGSKSYRFIQIQPYIANKQVTFLRGAKHADHVINHCSKITANDTHRLDDIADTLVDAVNISLLQTSSNSRDNINTKAMLKKFTQQNALLDSLQQQSHSSVQLWQK